MSSDSLRPAEVTFSDEHRGLFVRPPDARALLVLAHGAGAGMRHAFLESLAAALGAVGIASLRFDFPYLQRGRKVPDPPAVLYRTIRAAVAWACRQGLPVLAGGKSMGGRMTTQASAEAPLEGVRGLVLVGFPLHAAGVAPNIRRAGHLKDVKTPMLLLQGTRDDLCDLELLRPVLEALQTPPRLHVVEGADHSFHVLKRSGRTDAEVIAELAATIAAFADGP